MFRRLVSLILALPLFGCGTKPAKPVHHVDAAGAQQGQRVQFRVGDQELPEVHLPFKILEVYQNQKPMDIPPFHSDGGDWTFFDCQADSNISFVVGTVSKTTENGQPSSWGKAILAVADNESGRRFVEAISKAFGGTLPPPSNTLQTPVPLLINTAILGEDLVREDGGGFSGEGGGWTATKWFPSTDLTEAEVYFNFRLDQGQGEFSEKDADYADDLVSILASALRDGPRPPRTPENDPNLTLRGPKIGTSRKLLSRRTSLNTFTMDSRFAVFQDSTQTKALPLNEAAAEPIEIANFDYSPWQIRLVNDDMDLLVEEGVPEQPGVKSSADPMRIWWVDQKTMEKKLLRGPEKELRLSESSVSPDLRFVALDQYQTDPDDRARFKVIHFLDRTSGTTNTVKLAKTDLSLVNWRDTEAGIRAVGITNRWGFDKDQPSQSYLIDPVSGEMELQEQSLPSDSASLLSPDGKHRVQVAEGELIVIDVASGEKRQFKLHEEDRPFISEDCVDWVSSNYLKFNGSRLALIDVTTMKMSFPESENGTRFPSHAFTFSPDFRWVLYQGEDANEQGLFLAPVELPKD